MHPIGASFRRRLSSLLLASLCLPSASIAQTVWSGAGANDNWSTGANWVGGVAPPSANTTFVQFDATGARFGPIVDLPWTLNRIDLLGGSAYSLTGSALTLAGTAPQVNASGAAHSLGSNLDLSATAVFTVDSSLSLGAVSGAAA